MFHPCANIRLPGRRAHESACSTVSLLCVAAHVQWLLLATVNPAVLSVMAVVVARRWLFPRVRLHLLLVVLEVLRVTASACVWGTSLMWIPWKNGSERRNWFEGKLPAHVQLLVWCSVCRTHGGNSGNNKSCPGCLICPFKIKLPLSW